MKKVANVKTTELELCPHQSTLDHFKLIQAKVKRTRHPKTFLEALTNSVGFIKKCFVFNNLLCKWERDKQQDLNHLHSLELSVYNKSKIAYDIIKSRLIDNQLINQSEIQDHVQKLELLFANNEPTCSPAPWRLAFNGIKKLGSILEEMERTDLLSGLASFGTQIISQWDQHKLEYVAKNRIYIDYFTFADNIVELSDLREQFYYKIRDTPWAVWEQLVAISWCYTTPSNYWKNKRLRYSSRFYRKESWLRLNLHGMWNEINQIKQNTKLEGECVFQQKMIENYLNRLFANALGYLEKYQLIEKFHFFLDSDCLWIILEIPDQSFQFFKINEFNERKKIFGFVSQLTKVSCLTSFDIPHGYTTTSLLHHLNMPAKSQLAQLFFNGWSADQIHFKGKTISAKSVEPNIYIPDLLAELSNLHDRYRKRDFSFPLESFLSSIR